MLSCWIHPGVMYALCVCSGSTVLKSKILTLKWCKSSPAIVNANPSDFQILCLYISV